MTTYNTGNAVGSTDARDLYDNAQALDEAVNGTGSTYTDRRGVKRKTLKWMETAATGVPAVQAALDAEAAQTAAELARDAAFVNANVYADTAVGLAATTNGQQFQVVSGDTIIRYKNNAGTAEKLAEYPSTGTVFSQGVFSGFDVDKLSTTTSGSAENPLLDYTTLGSPIAATQFPFPFDLKIDSVSFNVSAAGNGEIHVYDPTSTSTSFVCVHVVPVSFTSGGLKTVSLGGLKCKKGGILAYRPIVGNLLCGALGAGRFYVLDGYTGVGSTVTYGFTNTSNPSLSYSFKKAVKGSLDDRTTNLESESAAIVEDVMYLKQSVGAIVEQGDVSFTQTLYSTPNQTIVSQTPVAHDGGLVEVSIRTGSSGNGEILLYEPVSATTWRCTNIIPVTFSAGGVHVFSVVNKLLPFNLHVKVGGFVGYKMIAGVVCNAANGIGGFHQMSNDADGVGGVNSFTFSNNYEPAIAYKIDTLGVHQPVVSRLTTLSAFINTRFALVPGTIAYTIGDSTVAATGYTEIINLVGTSREKINVAVGGDTFAGQKSKWLALNIDNNLIGWVIIQLGLNDLNPDEAASVAIARLQDLVNTVRADIGSDRPLLVAKMLPCRQRLIDIYGLTNGPIAQKKWVDINEAIAGNGANAITGVDYRIVSHVPLLDDGNGNLKPVYDSGDHIHENLQGRQIIADEWKRALNALCVVV